MTTHKPLDLTKPMQTRDGRTARYLGERCAPNGRSCVFAITSKLDSAYDHISCRFPDGTLDRAVSGNNDIVNVVERVVRYVSFYAHDALEARNDDLYYNTPGRKVGYRSFDANLPGSSCVKLTFEDGVLVDSEVVR